MDCADRASDNAGLRFRSINATYPWARMLPYFVWKVGLPTLFYHLIDYIVAVEVE